jgi:hypothetical protein
MGDIAMIRNTQKSPPVRVEHAIFISRLDFMTMLALLSLWIPASVHGQEFSGFLEDYSGFEAQGDEAR